jgi:subtilisin-like proprotein convertase family protein
MGFEGFTFTCCCDPAQGNFDFYGTPVVLVIDAPASPAITYLALIGNPILTPWPLCDLFYMSSLDLNAFEGEFTNHTSIETNLDWNDQYWPADLEDEDPDRRYGILSNSWTVSAFDPEIVSGVGLDEVVWTWRDLFFYIDQVREYDPEDAENEPPEITHGTPVSSTIVVPSRDSYEAALLAVTVWIDHPRASDLKIEIIAPGAEPFILSDGAGGDDYPFPNAPIGDFGKLDDPGTMVGEGCPVSFDDSGAFAIPAVGRELNSYVSPQVDGSFETIVYKPLEQLTGVGGAFNGKTVSGTWTLRFEPSALHDASLDDAYLASLKLIVNGYNVASLEIDEPILLDDSGYDLDLEIDPEDEEEIVTGISVEFALLHKFREAWKVSLIGPDSTTALIINEQGKWDAKLLGLRFCDDIIGTARVIDFPFFADSAAADAPYAGNWNPPASYGSADVPPLVTPTEEPLIQYIEVATGDFRPCYTLTDYLALYVSNYAGSWTLRITDTEDNIAHGVLLKWRLEIGLRRGAELAYTVISGHPTITLVKPLRAYIAHDPGSPTSPNDAQDTTDPDEWDFPEPILFPTPSPIQTLVSYPDQIDPYVRAPIGFDASKFNRVSQWDETITDTAATPLIQLTDSGPPAIAATSAALDEFGYIKSSPKTQEQIQDGTGLAWESYLGGGGTLGWVEWLDSLTYEEYWRLFSGSGSWACDSSNVEDVDLSACNWDCGMQWLQTPFAYNPRYQGDYPYLEDLNENDEDPNDGEPLAYVVKTCDRNFPKAFGHSFAICSYIKRKDGWATCQPVTVFAVYDLGTPLTGDPGFWPIGKLEGGVCVPDDSRGQAYTSVQSEAQSAAITYGNLQFPSDEWRDYELMGVYGALDRRPGVAPTKNAFLLASDTAIISYSYTQNRAFGLRMGFWDLSVPGDDPVREQVIVYGPGGWAGTDTQTFWLGDGSSIQPDPDSHLPHHCGVRLLWGDADGNGVGCAIGLMGRVQYDQSADLLPFMLPDDFPGYEFPYAAHAEWIVDTREWVTLATSDDPLTTGGDSPTGTWTQEILRYTRIQTDAANEPVYDPETLELQYDPFGNEGYKYFALGGLPDGFAFVMRDYIESIETSDTTVDPDPEPTGESVTVEDQIAAQKIIRGYSLVIINRDGTQRWKLSTFVNGEAVKEDSLNIGGGPIWFDVVRDGELNPDAIPGHTPACMIRGASDVTEAEKLIEAEETEGEPKTDRWLYVCGLKGFWPQCLGGYGADLVLDSSGAYVGAGDPYAEEPLIYEDWLISNLDWTDEGFVMVPLAMLSGDWLPRRTASQFIEYVSFTHDSVRKTMKNSIARTAAATDPLPT